jgi:hypothetical protein
MALVNSDGWSFDPNNQWVVVAEDILVLFSAVLRDAGWTILNRGDGTTLTSDGSAHNVTEWQNANAYEHYQDPAGAGGRELTLERGTSGSQVRAFMSRIGFNFATPTLSAAPTLTAADQCQVLGVGGAYDTSFIGTNVERHHLAANSVGQGASGDVYAFYWHVRSSGTGGFAEVMGVSPVTSAAGTVDTEPYLTFAGSLTPGAWYMAGLAGSAHVPGGLAFNSVSNLDGLNPYLTKYELPWYTAHDTTGGLQQIKGTLINERFDAVLADGSTYELTVEADARCNWSDIAWKWAHNVAPIL